MEYRTLGRTGLHVSEISLGSWRTAGDKKDPQDFVEIVTKAFDLGINLFDSAEVYSRGEAERIVGLAIGQLNRSEIVLATKCSGGPSRDHRNIGLNKKHMIEACEASLKRLGVEHIDLYQFHHPDAATPIEESVQAVGQLLRQGKVLYWGLSNYSPQQTNDVLAAARELGVERPVSHQPKYNMFKRDITEPLIPLCAREGVGLIVYSPLEQGVLTGKYASRDAIPKKSRLASHRAERVDQFLADYNFQALEQLKAIAETSGLTMCQLALAWVLREPGVSSAITGATSPEQVQANAAASGVRLSDEILKKIEDVLAVRWATIKIRDHEATLADRKKAGH
jgi:aryl-alcohol dehydrogenase-like predicted oxidoreductase